MRREEPDVAQASQAPGATHALPDERQPLAHVERVEPAGRGELVDDEPSVEPQRGRRLPARAHEKELAACLDHEHERDRPLVQPLRPGRDSLSLRREPLRAREHDLQAGRERPVGGRLDARRQPRLGRHRRRRPERLGEQIAQLGHARFKPAIV